jgi:hypothetical protein
MARDETGNVARSLLRTDDAPSAGASRTLTAREQLLCSFQNIADACRYLHKLPDTLGKNPCFGAPQKQHRQTGVRVSRLVSQSDAVDSVTFEIDARNQQLKRSGLKRAQGRLWLGKPRYCVSSPRKSR